MKPNLLVIACICLLTMILGLAGGIYVGMKRGVPFVEERRDWTIGIYRSTSPLDFPTSQSWRNPVLVAQDVTDARAKFVADPFLWRQNGVWNLFFEVYNTRTKQGDLALATSTDTKKWKYQGIVIDEPFHLSYPYIFEWENEHFLIPESFEARSIRLYRADEFPARWSYVQDLVHDVVRVDPSLVRHEDRWWLFAANVASDSLFLYQSHSLLGEWTEHPLSPIVRDDKHRARPSGRVLKYKERLYRFTMDVRPPNGTHLVRAFEITNLSTESYEEKSASQHPILQATGRGWNGDGMHQIDAHELEDGTWLAAVDGYGTYRVFGWKY